MANTSSGILINGKIHDWGDVKMYIAGMDFTEKFTAINWKGSKEKELQYAGGTEPIGAGYGKRAYTVDFTLTLDGAQLFEAICRAAGKDVLDYGPMLITVRVDDKTVAGDGLLSSSPRQVTNLMDVDITEYDDSQDEGTKKMVTKYTAICGKIVKV